MSDPRLSIIERRFRPVRRILAFASGKGGVGKSCCSSTAALLLAKGGMKTGLLDLDFHGASDHLILGIDPGLPGEKGGVLPIETLYGLRYMGIAPFTGEHGVALRGDAVTDAIRELLAVVIWGDLDVLIIDMPPGIGEAILDLSRYLRQGEVVLVTTPSTLSLLVMDRLVEVLGSGEIRIAGYLTNMVHRHEKPREVRSPQQPLREEGRAGNHLPLLGEIPYVEEIEEQIGFPDRLLAGRFAAALSAALQKLV
jgi:ATP-binding protein involved in chromosome partitioning